MIFSAVIFSGVEAFIRVGFSLTDYTVISDNFYLAKYNSPFLFDSNAVAIYILCYLFLCFYLLRLYPEYEHVKIISFVLFLLVCLVLTFSRASYVALLFFLFCFFLIRFGYVFVLIFFFVFLTFFLCFSEALFLLIQEDGSGNTKIQIFVRTYELLLKKELIDILFGYGMKEGGEIYSYIEGKYAHALIPLLLGQVGILGAVLYASYPIILMLRFCWIGTIYLLAFFLLGFSYLNTNTESVFIVFSLILYLGYKEKNEQKKIMLYSELPKK